MNLTRDEVLVLVEYINEIDAVIEADDGTLVPLPLLQKHEQVKELVYEIAERD